MCKECGWEDEGGEMGDEYGRTDLELVKLSMEEGEHWEAIHTCGERYKACDLDGWKRFPQRDASVCCCRSWNSFCPKVEGKHKISL